MDEKSRYLVVACMKSRGMLRSAYDQAVARFSDLGVSVFKLHSDGAKEYLALHNDLGEVIKVINPSTHHILLSSMQSPNGSIAP